MERDLGHIEDMILSARVVGTYLEEVRRADFLGNVQLQDAVIRRLEVVGEAAGRVSEEFRAQYPDIPWRQIIGMRNRMIHGYDSVDVHVVWETAYDYVPELLIQLEKLLRDQPAR